MHHRSPTPEVKAFNNFRSRRNGNASIVDFHIKVDPALPIWRAYDIATEVERRLRDEYSTVQANIHIEPYRGER